MSIDAPPPPPPPPPPPDPPPDPVNERIVDDGSATADPTDAQMDRVNAQTLVDFNKDLGRAQANGDTAFEQATLENIANVPASDDIKADPQGYLDGRTSDDGPSSQPGSVPDDGAHPTDEQMDPINAQTMVDPVNERIVDDGSTFATPPETAPANPAGAADEVGKGTGAIALETAPEVTDPSATTENPTTAANAMDPVNERIVDDGSTKAAELETDAVDTRPVIEHKSVVIIARQPSDLPDDVLKRLPQSELKAMEWPVRYESGPALSTEKYIAYNNFDWGDAPGDHDRREPIDNLTGGKKLEWASPKDATYDDKLMHSVHDLKAKAGAQFDIGDVLRPLDPNIGPAYPIDVHESRALIPDFHPGVDRYAAQNTCFELDVPAGTYREILSSLTAPRDSEIDNRKGVTAFPGQAPQVRLLDYDSSQTQLTVSPVGEMIDFKGKSGARSTYSYPDRL